MNKKILISVIAILAIIIIIVAAVLIYRPQNLPSGTEGIEITLPTPNGKILSPFEITGYITGEDSWTAFEAQAGTVQLFGEDNNLLGTAILTVTDEDWMKEFNNFKGEMDFFSPKNQNGKLVFHNENPSGLPEKDKTFTLPVKILKSSEKIKVKVYFSNNELDPEISCNKVFPVEREIQNNGSTTSGAVFELLKGPTQAEKDQGYYTSINDGVNLQSLKIGLETGTAWADFNDQLGYQVGGSCRVSAIRAQIEQTLLQWPDVKKIVISINGRTEDILQP